MDSTTVMILISALILCFHLVDIVAHRFRIPSVLLLMGLGIATFQMCKEIEWNYSMPPGALSGLGLLGLALIVLEGALGLQWQPGKLPLTARAGASSVLGIALFLIPATALLHLGWHLPWRQALLNSVPLAVISSAIAIPSASRLPERDKEFVSIESSLSDIFGVLLFNAIVLPNALGWRTLFRMGWSAIVVLIVSVIVVGGVLKLLRHSTHRVRFIPLLSVLVFFFSLGKALHLPSLLLVFLFGIVNTNLPRLAPGKIREWLVHDDFKSDAHLLETIVTELAFLARTFFFFLFGFSMRLATLTELTPWVLGGSFLVMIYFCRYLTLRFLVGPNIRQLLFIAPRGLITILLFGLIPSTEKLEIIASGAVLVIVLGTTLAQMLGGHAVTEAAGIPDLEELLPLGNRKPK